MRSNAQRPHDERRKKGTTSAYPTTVLTSVSDLTKHFWMWWPSPSSVSLPAFLRLNWPEARTTRHLTYGLILGVSLSIASQSVVANIQRRRREAHERQVGFEPRPIELRNDEVIQNVLGLIGNTPLVRIASLSDALGCEIYGKAEWLNPGGSVKDRVALKSTSSYYGRN
jgi:cysteine synthase A